MGKLFFMLHNFMPSCQSKVLKKPIFLILLLCVLNACNAPSNQLEQILDRGELRVVSRYGLTSYYNNGDQFAGFEYELAKRFAEFLGVELKVTVPPSLRKTLEMIDNGQADIAAAGLTITRARQNRLRFGPIYHEVTQQLIYRHGSQKPRDITEINDGQLEIVANSSHAEQLAVLQQEIPLLSWIENPNIDTSGLLELVQLELIDYTIVDSNEMATSHSLYPELRVAFDISDPQPIAWGMQRSDDMSLQLAVQAFLKRLKTQAIWINLLKNTLVTSVVLITWTRGPFIAEYKHIYHNMNLFLKLRHWPMTTTGAYWPLSPIRSHTGIPMRSPAPAYAV